METQINVKLIRFTNKPEIAVATAARMCYSGAKVSDLMEKMTQEKAEKLINKIIELGHYSVLEHASFTFAIEGISRACSHQLVRHRIASYSQQSQRYVNAGDFDFVIPKKIKSNPEALKEFNEVMEKTSQTYQKLVELVPKEDARFVLPNAAETKIIVTMNTRSLYNFFERRTCTRAQWEIRQLAEKMLEEAKKAAPLLFSKAGASCISKGYCPEGEMSCGKWKGLGAMLKKGNEWEKATKKQPISE